MPALGNSKFGITSKFPTYRKSLFISVNSWLHGKRKDDGAEGLWRIDDTLYDFSSFISKHPGGKFWLQVTKGTDITEAFASHHISLSPQRLLNYYAVREAKTDRNYLLTMEPDGFYNTLKLRVRNHLSDIKFNNNDFSNTIHDGLLLSTLVFSILTALKFHLVYLILSALSLCWLSITSHNYFHRRDNWRMYTFNLTLMNFNTWRISHALSHHVYPNSLLDLEMSMFEPFLCWIPDSRIAGKFQRYIMFLFQPVIYALIYPFHFLIRLVLSIYQHNVMYWHDTLGFSLPLIMVIVSQQSVIVILEYWIMIILLSSFIFGVIGLNAAHHDPKIYHEGDERRENQDWGLYQIDTIIDRGDIKNSQFLVLTHFGHHALHHLFPTLDHGILPKLYAIFLETLDEFKLNLRHCNHLEHIIGQNRQLLRITPNKIKP